MNKIFKCIAVYLLLLSAVTNSKAQTNCGWQQGEFETYSQISWGDESFAAGTLLQANFLATYPNDLTVGTGYTIRLTEPGAVYSLLPALGSAGVLTGSVIDPQTTNAGEFAGHVVALKLNIDFSDANLLPNTIPFGDLIFHDVTTLPELNGQSVREFLATAEILLGGSSASFGISTATAVATILNDAFLNGTPSQFAQDHLRKGWSSGEFETYSQFQWGAGISDARVLLSNEYNAIYGGTLIAGGTFFMLFTSATAVDAFLPQLGTAGALTASAQNPVTTSAGELAGEVLALKLNVDLSDAGLLGGNYPLGDLVFHDYTEVPELNGQTVRQFLSTANTLLGGDGGPFNAVTAAVVASEINFAFANGTPSQFAQEHLRKGWSSGDMFTRSQLAWDGTTDWYSDYGTTYQSTFGIVEVGIPGASGFSMRWTAPDNVSNYFVATGTPAALDADQLDPNSNVSGQFGGSVLALTLNIDFSDAGFLSGNVNIPFGDLILRDYTTAPALNGYSVREILAFANELLGGGTGFVTIAEINFVAELCNSSFVNGTPSQFAKGHLISPCDVTNQCPAAGAISEPTAVGIALNIQLQGSDADGNTLTYTISQNPSHGTATTTSEGAATYTPAAGYSGTDQFKYTVSDGQCDAEATVDVTIVVCPKKKGDWKNNPVSWPASATPMLLGTISYTQAQLITILNTPAGSGPKADASLILAHQLIPAKLSIANGTVASAEVLSAITSANALIGNNIIPMKVKPKTPLGQSMIALATLLEAFNNGSFTEGCQPAPTTTITKQVNTTAETINAATERLEVKAFPNPSASDFTLTPQTNSKERMVMQVIDMHGRIIETRNVNANSMMRFGDRYRPGTYFVRIVQGKEHKEIKLVKLPD